MLSKQLQQLREAWESADAAPEDHVIAWNACFVRRAFDISFLPDDQQQEIVDATTNGMASTGEMLRGELAACRKLDELLAK